MLTSIRRQVGEKGTKKKTKKKGGSFKKEREESRDQVTRRERRKRRGVVRERERAEADRAGMESPHITTLTKK